MGKRERIQRYIRGEHHTIPIKEKQIDRVIDTCKETGKEKFLKKAAMSSVSIQNRTQDLNLSIYKCPFCRYWHKTSSVASPFSNNKHTEVKSKGGKSWK